MRELNFDGYITDEFENFELDEFEEANCKHCGHATIAAYDEDGNFIGSSCCGTGEELE